MDMVWSQTLVGYALAAAECRDTSSAASLFDLLAPWADQWASTGTSISVPISLAVGVLASVLGRYDEADRYFVQTAEVAARLHARFHAAMNDRWWGQMLAERNAPGDIDGARDLLYRAQTVAAANGYAYIERRATEALQRLG